MDNNQEQKHSHMHSETKHSHTHEHNDHHVHEHSHEGNDELHMLNVLLDHWVHHNEEHASDFYKWSEKATKMGKTETAESILEAIAYVQKANESLVKAKEKIK